MRLQIRTNIQGDEVQLTARYVNGLKFQLQDEFTLVKTDTVDEGVQYALKTEEKWNRKGKTGQKRGGSTSIRGKGSSSKSPKRAEPKEGQYVRPNFRGRERLRGRDTGFGDRAPLRCFISNEPHKSQEYPLNPRAAHEVMIAQEESHGEEVESETGETLMLQRTLVMGSKQVPKHDWRRKSIFQTRCKCKGRFAR